MERLTCVCPSSLGCDGLVLDLKTGTISLNPLVDYLEGGSVLDKLGVWFHLGLSMFICCSCHVALTSEVLKGHLKAQHQHPMTAEDAEDLQSFLCHHHIFGHSEDVPVPCPGGRWSRACVLPSPGTHARWEGVPTPSSLRM
ncbi:hypothetical protein JVT61DRAFT_10385 [Boletus reticuloceps]|uniref:Uncharacterized protein n=1 Tax=Boletus reticuloceps TaxID=495285 RepID=A0A8I3AEU7_9AGAM|nr:hypothetical protein JVT61DRAFT_10385 [Boletus reticuloceps]